MTSDYITIDGFAETRGRPRAYHKERASTALERSQAHKGRAKTDKIRRVAVLDMESDPFDNEAQTEIYPFTACLYSDQFETIVIWNENFDEFVDELLAAIENLPEAFTIYAHNGGKFDYMFLVHKLRGKVSFKGRGIMSAKIGAHELRDSFHIIPEKLANYKKDEFDYNKLKRNVRAKHRDEIIGYMVNDCKYLFEIVKGFLARFGFKISIGQAAMTELKKFYTIGKLGEHTDTTLREYFFGGRVECLAGKGHFISVTRQGYKLIDVNSMYPDAMANNLHPISEHYTFRRNGGITSKTVFIDVSGRNYGALVKRAENNETTANVEHGRFKTTIYEFRAALELGLFEVEKIHGYVDNERLTNFSDFILPLYEERQHVKARIKEMRSAGLEEGEIFNELLKDDIFLKLLLNNAYGKFAQNPRNFKEHFLTSAGDAPPPGFEDQDLPSFRGIEYDIWTRPQPLRTYNNVGTAASITGAARAKLMRAIHAATDPIYCDTDSLICRDIDATQIEIHPTKLGAWDLEAEFDEVIIAGKKLYSCKVKGKEDGQKGRVKVRSKGVSGLDWNDMEALLRGEVIASVNKAPTFNKTGTQFYMTRKVRATVPTLAQMKENRMRLTA